MRNVLKAIILGSCIIPFSVLATTPQIQNVKAMQQYPWDTKVYIAFTVVGDVSAVYPNEQSSLRITATDNETGKSYVASQSAISGDTGTNEGLHKVVWDLNKQGADFSSEQVVFTAAYFGPLYCVIDLSGGVNAEIYPITYLMDIPKGGWTEEYKTTKLVLRRVNPGRIPTRAAVITKPFYIGVFEVTQKQYELVMGTNPSEFNGEMRPVECVSYEMIRGSANGSQWPISSEVDADSFMGKIREKTGIAEFDLPTEAQWEYACRAGTTSKYNNGGDSLDDLNLLGRTWDNRMDISKGGFRGHTTVGSYLPNQWGLYDMHGNVQEFCLDRWEYEYNDDRILSGNDPVGPSEGVGTRRVIRGGAWSEFSQEYASSERSWGLFAGGGNATGFRLVRNLLQ